ncbi:hypothetical protein [Nordella sp. HKS 07]|uniref:hypothetical protein n=1 Tax=Nordella sp. HKS 07 TaxID=2712222 RepID=UPI001FEF8150|nr:hypothetical protein [Nordella sp. HKS 07]
MTTSSKGALLAASPALAAILVAIAVGLLPVATIGIGEGLLTGHIVDAYVLRILWFTLLQAGLSTLLSIAFALPVALALARLDFPGRNFLLRLFALPLALPAIVVILGIVAVYGRTGWIATLTGSPINIYGLAGILLAHVFFNLPLATRLLLQQLEGIAPESWRLAAQLDFTEGARFRLIEWPQLRASLPGIASLIFLLCAASFAVVLTLGGGPSATTLEVGIYQALRFDYDPARATVLSLVQLVLCGLFVLLAGQYAQAVQNWPSLRGISARYETRSPASAFALALIIAAAALFVGIPILAIVISGLAADFNWPALSRAILTSLLIALPAALLQSPPRLAPGAGQRQGDERDGPFAPQSLGTAHFDRAAGGAGDGMVHRGEPGRARSVSRPLSRHRHECADGAAFRAWFAGTRHAAVDGPA